MVLKSVRPFVPPRFVSLRLKTSQAMSAKACVMMAKYTPRMRLRNARNPKMSAKQAGARDRPARRQKAIKGFPEEREFRHLIPDHEIRQRAAVDALAPDGEHEMHAHAIGADSEKHALAEAQDACISPDEIQPQSARMAKARNLPNRLSAKSDTWSQESSAGNTLRIGKTNNSTNPTIQNMVPSCRSALDGGGTESPMLCASILLYSLAFGVPPLTANNPDGRRCRNKITNTRIKTLP